MRFQTISNLELAISKMDFLTTLMLELNGEPKFTPSEIKELVDHAGHLEPLKLLVIDSLLMELMLFFLHKISSLAIRATMDVQEELFKMPGHT